MRRALGVTMVYALVLVAMAWSAATAGAQAEVSTFCASRSNLAAAEGQQDETAVQVALDALAASAPAEVQQQATTQATLFEKRGPAAFETKKGSKAGDAIDKFVVANCGFPVLEVNGIDYEFDGLSGPVTAGPYVVEFTNDAPKEHHEMVLLRTKPGVTLSVKKLLALSEKDAAEKADVLGAAFAKPDDTDAFVVFLDPGRYVVSCFVDVGTTSSSEHGGGDEHGGAAKPHWTKGMRGEFEVVGAA